MIPFQKQVKRLLKRGQTGQAVIILAAGFVVLLGFVGIVTDVSLMFVRYAALRRAVDSAAVAAAGQMRQDRDFATVGVAARQFLEFHGISANTVLVETCDSTRQEIRLYDGYQDSAGDPAAEADYIEYVNTYEGGPDQYEIDLAAGDPLDIVPDGAPKTGDNSATVSTGDEDLCTEDQRKLVRVTAQIESPTVFMHLLGFEPLTLQASAISETAVLDVVIVLDVSESMLSETTHATWEAELLNNPDSDNVNFDRYMRYLPPRMTEQYGFYCNNFFDNSGPSYCQNPIPPLTEPGLSRVGFNRYVLENFSEDDLLRREYQQGLTVNEAGFGFGGSLLANGYGGVLDVPNGASTPLFFQTVPYYMDSTGTPVIPTGLIDNSGVDEAGVTHSGVAQMPELCRVRAQPRSVYVEMDPDLHAEYELVAAELGREAWFDPGNGQQAGNIYDFFVPGYNFYGCCNDPTASSSVDANGNIDTSAATFTQQDWDFSDLVCQPFKGARDATRLFLDRIDFFRGDRVAFVTFDQNAYLIDPDGYQVDLPVKSGTVYETSGVVNAGDTIINGGDLTPMIDNRATAVQVLNRVIGVRAEPAFYYTDHVPEVDDLDLWDEHSIGTVYVEGDINGDGAINQLPNGQLEGFSTGLPMIRDVDNPPTLPVGVAEHEDVRPNIAQWTAPTDDYYDLPIGLNRNYLVNNGCVMDNAVLWGAESVWVPTRIENPGIHPGVLAWDPEPGATGDDAQPIMQPNPEDPAWSTWYSSSDDPDNLDPAQRLFDNPPAIDVSPTNPKVGEARWKAWFSYEYRAGCRGTNVGAALRSANNALVDPATTRRDGSVWVIVFLGDGAAGATDPVPLDDDVEDIIVPRPYLRTDNTESPNNNLQDPNDPFSLPVNSPDPEPGDYGAFGFCPYGENQALKIGFADQAGGPAFPYCSDTDPTTRSYCNTGDGSEKSREELEGVLTQSLDDPGDCRFAYDVDDYARDWADYVGLERPGAEGASQLPSIFTIAFGLDYATTSTDMCAANPQDCLGEELLRYIADVGDNNRVDGDYPTTPGDSAAAGRDYGNYFNAPDEERLNDVFDEIASKMFTRISR